MPETTPLIKAALNLRGGAGFDVYVFSDLFFKYCDYLYRLPLPFLFFRRYRIILFEYCDEILPLVIDLSYIERYRMFLFLFYGTLYLL